jgi:hypothetical protein
LAAAYYHYGNVSALEQKAIEEAFHTAPPVPGRYGGTYGFGASEKFSFEYIAFTFALRRTMDYLAVSVVVCRIFCKLDCPIIPHLFNPYP